MRLEEQVGALLKTQNHTIATAESCTGGLIAHRLTDVPGSSSYLMGGIVAYSNDVKIKLLAVQEETLLRFGAVSAETAEEMVLGVKHLLDTDYAVSVTGIAGPGGGTEDKPVGLTYIGFAGRDNVVIVERHVWRGDRISNKQSSADAALRLVLQHLAQN
ncbi:MAG: hypothetical protein OHK0046_12570 [Anaerolineae bacterium]